MIYGKKIKEVRIRLDKSQKEMAKELKVSQSYLCGIENETKRPNGDLIIELINKFHVSPFWLKSGTGPIFLNDEDLFFINTAAVSDKSVYYNFPVLKELNEKEPFIKAGNLIQLQIDSDNMDPEIKKGDLVIVDTSIKATDTEGTYLFELNDKKIVRQLLFVPQKHLVSLNPSLNESSIVFDSSIDCIGKLICLSRNI